jgi:hypothetical protein
LPPALHGDGRAAIQPRPEGAARADEHSSGECPARALMELPRWPLASLASAAVGAISPRRAASPSVAPPRLPVDQRRDPVLVT